MLTILPKNPKPPYEVFYEDNYQRVVHYLRNKITNYEDAEDLASEVFVYCFSHYDSYDPEKSSLTTWLYLIVNSRLKNYYRDHVTFADFESVADTMQDQSLDMDEGIYLEQLHGALMRSIKTLPDRQQKIVMMPYFQNYSANEIATRLGISPGNVRVLLSRALDKLASSNDAFWKEYKNNG
jgi:RNA polymerase sigma-70 factor (ECF subfamily)